MHQFQYELTLERSSYSHISHTSPHLLQAKLVVRPAGACITALRGAGSGRSAVHFSSVSTLRRLPPVSSGPRWGLAALLCPLPCRAPHPAWPCAAASFDAADTESIESAPSAPAPDYCIVNFYHLVDIPRPGDVVREHKVFLEGRDVRGRIYISEQGINAQYGGTREDAVAYAEWLVETQPLFAGLRYSVDAADDHMFPKLRLKY